jgi:hypothetical protein
METTCGEASMYNHSPFIEAANTDVLHRAFDQLVGKGKWIPCMSIGTFPVRFPSIYDPGDTGWHAGIGVIYGFLASHAVHV